jgi:AGZA family xanthine/uracil permease-like MFS transporter
MRTILERHFQLREHGTDLKRECVAGLATFVTMVYIIFVNTNIMKESGMDPVALTIGTILAAAVPTIVMGIWTNLPWALAPGMGYNALFAYTVVLTLKIPWPSALALVFLDGVAFLLLVSGPWRQAIVTGIPRNLKLAAGAGIGLFIAYIGMVNAGIIKVQVLSASPLSKGIHLFGGRSALPVLGDLLDPPVVIALLGLLTTGFLLARGITGSLLLGIMATAGLAWIAGGLSMQARTALQVVYPTGLASIVQWPDFARFFQYGFLQFSFSDISRLPAGASILLFVIFLMTDIMDTLGTFGGLAGKMKILDAEGNFKASGRAIAVDAAAGIWGPLVGTATVVTYIESAAGVGLGGRTGLTAIWTAIFFLGSLFLVPLVGLLPPVATAPALIVIGFLMMEPLLEVEFAEVSEGLPAFLTMAVMPLSFSIADGMFAGILAFMVLKLIAGRPREVGTVMWGFGVTLLLAKLAQAWAGW